MKNQTNARLHRFGDSVAVTFPETGTLYLSADLADKLAGALQAGANEIRAGVKFTESRYATRVLDDSPTMLRAGFLNCFVAYDSEFCRWPTVKIEADTPAHVVEDWLEAHYGRSAARVEVLGEDDYELEDEDAEVIFDAEGREVSA